MRKSIICAESLTFCWLLLTTTQITAHLHYVGCYKGNTTQYITVDLPTSGTLTVEFCIQDCKQLLKTYSLIQGGLTCLCGDDYDQILPDEECQVPCAGNKLQYCGGKNLEDGTAIYVVYTAKSFLRQYIGCFKDDRIRAIERIFSWRNARNNTIDSCIRHCGSHNYTYAGLQFGYQCFCGNSYDKYGPLPESGCNMNCSGYSSEICGGSNANSVYAVNSCSNDKDCQKNESCNVIDLNYMNVSRCRCKQGFHRMTTWDLCTDVDECQLDGPSTACNVFSEYCVNSIGSYICICKETFTCGKCEEFNSSTAIGIIITLETIMTISLLFNVGLLFVVSKIKRVDSAESRKPEPGKGSTHSDFQPSFIKASDQHENNCDDTPDPVGETNVYEQIIPEQCQIVQDPTSEYTELKLDDNLNVESSI